MSEVRENKVVDIGFTDEVEFQDHAYLLNYEDREEKGQLEQEAEKDAGGDK